MFSSANVEVYSPLQDSNFWVFIILSFFLLICIFSWMLNMTIKKEIMEKKLQEKNALLAHYLKESGKQCQEKTQTSSQGGRLAGLFPFPETMRDVSTVGRNAQEKTKPSKDSVFDVESEDRGTHEKTAQY